MKTKFLFLILIVASSTAYLVSCSDTVSPSPKVSGPSISLVDELRSISSDTILEQNKWMEFVFKYTDDVSVAKIEITVSYDGGPRVTPENCEDCIQEPNLANALGYFDYQSRDSAVGTEKWFFKAIDNSGNSTEVSVTVTNSEKIVPIKEDFLEYYNQAHGDMHFYYLGDDDAIGGNYAPTTVEGQKRVTLLHLYDAAEKKHLLCGPSSSYSSTLLMGNSSTSTWSVRNKTMFRKTSYTTADFDAIETTKFLRDEDKKTDPMYDHIGNLEEGDIYYVKLESGQSYICRIQSFTKYKTPSERMNVYVLGR